MSTDLNTDWSYPLRKGHSDDPSRGACAMDAVNWLVHGRHGDKPECACPVIGAYVITGNDKMDDETRQRLKGYLHRIAGSRSPAHEAARVRVLVLAAVRIFVSRALDRAGLTEIAKTLRELPDDASYGELVRAADAAWAAVRWVDAAWATAEAAKAVKMAVRMAAVRAAGAAAVRMARVAAEASIAGDWSDYFTVLDQVLNAGPQGEPWSADVVIRGEAAFTLAKERVHV